MKVEVDTRKSKRELAKELFTRSPDEITVSLIAKNLQVSRQSASKWRKEDDWDNARNRYQKDLQERTILDEKQAQSYIAVKHRHLEDTAKIIDKLKVEMSRRAEELDLLTLREIESLTKIVATVRELEISVFGKVSPETESANEYLVVWTGRIKDDIDENEEAED